MITTYENEEMNCSVPPLWVLPIWPGQSSRTLANVEYRRCILDCEANSHNRRYRPLIRNVKLLDCAMSGTLYGAIVEEVLVDGLRTGKWLHSCATVFKHVTLRGKIGRIMIGQIVWRTEDESSPANRYYARANATYYANVDWALDIRAAQFIEADLRGMPGHLILRDPTTQVLVTREKALQGTWRKLDLSDTYWPLSIEMFLKSELASIVLVAPKRVSDFRKLLDGLNKLRDAGVAEPD